MFWFNYIGLVVVIALLVTNIILFAKKPAWLVRPFKNKIIQIVELVSCIGCLALMIFNIPHTYFGFIFDDAFLIYVILNSILVVLYIDACIICYKRHPKLRGYSLSILSTAIFFISGILLLNIPLIIFSIAFGVSHIYMSIKNIREEVEVPGKRKALFAVISSISSLLAVLIIAVGSTIFYLSATEYNPDTITQVEVHNQRNEIVQKGQDYTLMSWNVGYGVLDKNTDFFMDGGSQVRGISKEITAGNISATAEDTLANNPDFVFYQEVDVDSTKSNNVDEVSIYTNKFKDFAYTRAINYKVDYIPYPLPPLGKVDSGLLTFSKYKIDNSVRMSLPCMFSWPLRVANLKRCLSINRLPIDGDSEHELVLINLHLEAFDDGEAKKAQTEALKKVLDEELNVKNNYVIAGGDFNQIFESVKDTFPIRPNVWTPGKIKDEEFEAINYQVCTDTKESCRAVNQPYITTGDKKVDNQFYIIDGLLVSRNITVKSKGVMTEYDFAHSDHNPYKLSFSLNNNAVPNSL